MLCNSRNKNKQEKNLHLFLRLMLTYCQCRSGWGFSLSQFDSDLQVPNVLEVLLSRKSSKCESGIPAAPSFRTSQFGGKCAFPDV